MPAVLTYGWDCATPACWICGSGSVTKQSATRTGLIMERLRSVIGVQLWKEEDGISGSVKENMRNITLFVLQSKF